MMLPNYRPPVSVSPAAAEAMPHLFPQGLEDWTLVWTPIGATDREMTAASWDAAVQVYGEFTPDQLRVHGIAVVCPDPQNPGHAVVRLAIRVDPTPEPS